MRRNEEAREALLRACAIDPSHVAARVLLGAAENALENPSDALTQLMRALEIDPQNVPALRESAQALLALGRTEQALVQLKKAVRIDPADTQARYMLTRALFARGARAEASLESARLREMKAAEARVNRARVLSNFALAAVEQQDWSRALDQLGQALEVCGACKIRATLHKNLGLVKSHAGDRPGAIAELREAVKLAPGDRDAQYALELLARPAPE